mmetsp:Transcript_53745/g.65885  ORF Transcript_53745/g.65885 Transcript_53745/m.65885 type:complete len:143 (+) Transcript_53745:64-492(+)
MPAKKVPNTGGKHKSKSKSKSKRTTKAAKAGLKMNVSRVLRRMKDDRVAQRISPLAAVFMTAALEYMLAELIEVSGACAEEFGKKQIKPRHIYLAVRKDDELDYYLGGVTFPYSGVVPNVNSALLKKSKKKSKSKRKASQEY